jgi:endonuclease YncB( thermonuclease family)
MTSRRLLHVLAVLAVLGTAPATAQAAFPGNNGRVAFSRETTAGNTEIFTVGRDGGAATRLTTIAGADDEPAWSPDGSRIAFTSERGGSPDVWVMNADGSGAVQLTGAPGEDRDPAWSPDGTRLAFTSDRDGDDDVYVMNADGSGQTNVTNTGITIVGGDTVTAPDGSTITLPSFRFGHERGPAWSQTGRIAFATDRDRNNEVYAMNADGSGQTNLSRSTGQDTEPSWSPDGARLAHTMAGFPADGVGLRNAGGGGFVSLAETPGWDESPAFSPDGRRIAFRGRQRPAGPGIYTMRTDRALLTRVTTGPTDAHPDWQPCAACPPQLDPVTPPPAPDPGSGATGGSTGSEDSGPRGDAPAWAPEAPGGGIIQLSGTGARASGSDSPGAGSSRPGPKAPPRALTIGARVIRVTGGDTVRVELFNASRRFANLRLLGIDARGFGSRACGRSSARSALRALLTDKRGRGRTLILKTDPKVATFDRLGRLQAYARTRSTNVPVQNAMLAGGWARARSGRHALRARYLRLEKGARSARRGLWRRCVSR